MSLREALYAGYIGAKIDNVKAITRTLRTSQLLTSAGKCERKYISAENKFLPEIFSKKILIESMLMANKYPHIKPNIVPKIPMTEPEMINTLIIPSSVWVIRLRWMVEILRVWTWGGWEDRLESSVRNRFYLLRPSLRTSDMAERESLMRRSKRLPKKLTLMTLSPNYRR